MRDSARAFEMLAAFRRVGVVTAEEHEASAPEWRPDDRVRYLPPAWYVEVLSRLPDGAGPARVRAHLRAALDALNALNAAEAGPPRGG